MQRNRLQPMKWRTEQLINCFSSLTMGLLKYISPPPQNDHAIRLIPVTLQTPLRRTPNVLPECDETSR